MKWLPQATVQPLSARLEQMEAAGIRRFSSRVSVSVFPD